MSFRITTRLSVALLVAGAAACADSTAPSAGVTEVMATQDVAIDAAEATGQDLEHLGGLEALIGMSLAPGVPAPYRGCSFDVATSLYGCPPITTPEGLTLRRWFGIYDEGGHEQPSFDASSTESIVFGFGIEGTIVQPDRTVWVSQSRLVQLRGLAGAETQRIWRGGGSRDDSAHVSTNGVTRRVRFRSEDNINDVVFKLPRSEFPFPQSGTITHLVSVTATVPDGTEATNRNTGRRVVVTFNGTRTASMVVGDTPCSLDLVTHHISCNQ
jgi:hypothetical protein